MVKSLPGRHADQDIDHGNNGAVQLAGLQKAITLHFNSCSTQMYVVDEPQSC